MKKIFTIVIVIIVSSFLFSSCNKYEEGPAISFFSPKNRITGTFTLENVIIDEKIYIPEDLNIKEDTRIFNKNGTGERIIKMLVESNVSNQILEWEFDDKKEHIRERKKIDDETWGTWTSYYTILRLTKKELWILVPDEDGQKEYHYKKQ
ncbi:MAG: hypothetical protein LBQ22_06495 [Bacteroidales bacterium]|jgi:hypothetical protein|nr:hypothetical protein [Bacteroidales bacterium]